jgi:alkaline phosphatase
MATMDVENGGKYRIAQRNRGRFGLEVLNEATDRAIAENTRLLAFFGVGKGHLPFQTADGGYNPTRGDAAAEEYRTQDVSENVTLADMTRSALRVLERNEKGFWLMIEAGDVDWANHDNNIDNSIGAVLSGDDAFRSVTDWVEQHDAWDDTAVILTADHGHYFMLKNSQVLLGRGH